MKQIDNLFIKQNTLVANLPDIYHRQIYSQFITDSRVFIGIVGPRGIGKTTLLLELLRLDLAEDERNSLYVSADSPFFLENSILELVDTLDKHYPTNKVYLDEIHRYPNWQQELKNIFDQYPNMQFVFSGSSAIDIIRSKYDLSRRVIIKALPGLSFREYLETKLDDKLPIFSLSEILENHTGITNSLKLDKVLLHFRDYLKMGYYLYRLEIEEQTIYEQSVINAMQKAVYEDISLTHGLRTFNLRKIEKILHAIANSSPGKVSAYKLAKNLELDIKTVAEYFEMLRQANLLRYLVSDAMGYAFAKNPEKIYIDNPNLMFALTTSFGKDEQLGRLRETFFINQMLNAELIPTYSKTADFVVQENIFEIGGANKTSKQIQGAKSGYLALDGIEFGTGNKIPLWLFGFMY